MRKGLTANIDAIIEKVATMESIKPYILCGGTALAMQLGHRKSEDLDFMMWRKSKTEKPQVDWAVIEKELKEKIGEIENFNMLGFDQVEFLVAGVKFSFYVSDNYSPSINPVSYLGNIHLADIYSIMAMKMEVMLRRMKMRDYYDIYAILKEGYDISKGIKMALSYSRHKLSTKNIVVIMLSDRFIPDENFQQLDPQYDVSREDIRRYLLQKLKDANLVKNVE
ncbi:MAG: nucleotidyl transferase AbiEii/AbiGii toxin family protein [Mangrovibacterium sp.]